MKNTTMTQEEHISLLQQQRKTKAALVLEKINVMQARYVRGEEHLITEIINELDKKYHGTVVHQLYIAGCYDDENEHTAMQEARLAVWQRLEKSRKDQEIDSAFSYKCKGIYYYKALDVVRSVYTKNKQYNGEIDSTDAESSGKESERSILTKSNTYSGKSPDKVIEADKKRAFFDFAFEMYCKALTNSDAEPRKCLVLYYARILPHILHVCFSQETIPASKIASPKWAIEKMGQRNVGELSTESEMQLKEYVSDQLMWCEAFLCQLNDVVASSCGMQMMKNIILANEYDEKKMGHMIDYMHIIIAKDWHDMMKKDAGVIEDAVDYTVGLDKISKLLKGAGR